MEQPFLLWIKGFFLGLAKITPGVSGSLLAVSFGVYEKGIEAISGVFHHPKKYLPFLGIAGFGILLGIMVGSRVIFYFLSSFYLPTMLLFLGLITGTVPSFLKREVTWNRKTVVLFLVVFFVLWLLTKGIEGEPFVYEPSWKTHLYLIFLGFLDAATMILPGVSGTAFFLMLGCYPFILTLFSHLPFFFSYVPFYFFGIGLLLGIYLVSKGMNALFQKNREFANALIGSLAVSSSLLLCFPLFHQTFTLSSACLGFFLFCTGFFLSKRID